MPGVLARNLIDRAVIGSDGTELGTLSTVTMNPETGELGDLVIAPRNEDPDGVEIERDDEGRYTVPVGTIKAAGDHIVIER